MSSQVCKGLLSITNLNKEIPLISCFNFCKFVQWTASIKLLIMFLLFFDLIENTSFTKNLFYFIILGLNLLHYVCIKLTDYFKEFRSLTEN